MVLIDIHKQQQKFQINQNLILGYLKSYFVIPHPEKQYKGGEDALYADQNILSVADGVGGWADQGIDPAKYSKQLCENVKNYYYQNPEQFSNDPKSLLKKAVINNKHQGSSTLVISTLSQKNGQLKCTFIGDSCYMLMRQENEKLNIIKKSQQQQHSFNFPFQVGRAGKEGDDPNYAIQDTLNVQKDDLILLGTDGLFDNMETQNIKDLIEIYLQNNSFDGMKLSKIIAETAFKISLNPRVQTPFAKEALKAGYRFNGGKSDDITVVIAKIE